MGNDKKEIYTAISLLKMNKRRKTRHGEKRQEEHKRKTEWIVKVTAMVGGFFPFLLKDASSISLDPSPSSSDATRSLQTPNLVVKPRGPQGDRPKTPPILKRTSFPNIVHIRVQSRSPLWERKTWHQSPPHHCLRHSPLVALFFSCAPICTPPSKFQK